MKKGLLLFWHGIGDLLCLTPTLRELHRNGFHCDILVRQFVVDSKIFDVCPYANLLPLSIVNSPSGGGEVGKRAKNTAVAEFAAIKEQYQGSVIFSGTPERIQASKSALFYDTAMRAFGLPMTANYEPLEVFISASAENEAKESIAKHFPNGYIFQHTEPDRHPAHVWNPASWMRQNLPALPVFKANETFWEDINTTFVMAREANHRVLSSSVMVHACDAMNATMDIVNYGRPNPQGWPDDMRKIKLMRMQESRTEKFSVNGGKTWWP
jgi:hypothetical protein